MDFKKTSALFFLALFLMAPSCGNSDDEMPGNSDAFDREVLLSEWADNYIIPSYEEYYQYLKFLQDATNNFLFLPEVETHELEHLRTAFLDSYIRWQQVAWLEIGKAESIGLRNFTNIYPTDTEEILENINSGDYNLELPSLIDAQGFPALDFLLYGVAQSDAEILVLLNDPAYKNYFKDLVDRLTSLTQEVRDDWNGTYRDTFVQNDGSSETASVDKMINDFLFHYERYLRAGKVGLPAGVFTGNPDESLIEAPYSKIYSKYLLKESLGSMRRFFANDNQTGLDDYLETVQVSGATTPADIQANWDTAMLKIEALNDNLHQQVIDDNSKMLEVYDALQAALVPLKVDMMQALNIQVDYVDADGD